VIAAPAKAQATEIHKKKLLRHPTLPYFKQQKPNAAAALNGAIIQNMII